MSGAAIYIKRLCAWASGIESGEWELWAQGKKQISPEPKSPDISFTDPLFRRRLSQLSKMTVQVIHDILPLGEDTKIFFFSFRGELSRQYQINKMLIEEKSLMPAAFSLSVFNAPAALAAMAFGLKAGYSAVYPGRNSFAAGLAAAQAALLTGSAEEIVFVYADESAPPEYAHLLNEEPCPLAFALLLSRSSGSALTPEEKDSPCDFLKKLILSGEINVSC